MCAYNKYVKYFDRTFFKFLLGFLALVTISLLVISYVQDKFLS